MENRIRQTAELSHSNTWCTLTEVADLEESLVENGKGRVYPEGLGMKERCSTRGDRGGNESRIKVVFWIA